MIFAISGVIMTTNIDLGSMFRDYKVEEGTVPNDLHGGDIVFLIVRRHKSQARWLESSACLSDALCSCAYLTHTHSLSLSLSLSTLPNQILYISAIAIRFLSTFSLYALDITVLRNLKWPRCCRCIAFDMAEHIAAYPAERAPPATAWHRLRQGLKPSKYRLVREYDMTWRVAVVTSWGGLRGAVGLCLAMMVSQEFGSEFETENSLAPLGPKFMFHMSGIAFLTLVLNGSTAGALVHALGLVTAPPEAKVAWHGVTQELHAKLKELIHELKSDPMCVAPSSHGPSPQRLIARFASRCSPSLPLTLPSCMHSVRPPHLPPAGTGGLTGMRCSSICRHLHRVAKRISMGLSSSFTLSRSTRGARTSSASSHR